LRVAERDDNCTVSQPRRTIGWSRLATAFAVGWRRLAVYASIRAVGELRFLGFAAAGAAAICRGFIQGFGRGLWRALHGRRHESTRLRHLTALDSDKAHPADILEELVDFRLRSVADARRDTFDELTCFLGGKELVVGTLKLPCPTVLFKLSPVEAPTDHIKRDVCLVHILALERPDRSEQRL
jgi:hypothetical protein